VRRPAPATVSTMLVLTLALQKRGPALRDRHVHRVTSVVRNRYRAKITRRMVLWWTKPFIGVVPAGLVPQKAASAADIGIAEPEHDSGNREDPDLIGDECDRFAMPLRRRASRLPRLPLLRPQRSAAFGSTPRG